MLRARAAIAALVLLGVTALALPLLDKQSGSTSTDILSALGNDPEATAEFRTPGVVRAAAPAAPTSVRRAQAPVPAAAPVGAPRATGARSVDVGPRTLRGGSSPAAAITGRYSLVLVVESGSPLEALAARARELLQASAIDARVAEAAQAGRPDAVLLLGIGQESDVWFCDVPGSGSADLASALLAALPPPTGASVPPSFDCQSVHGSRARTPAAYLQLNAASPPTPEHFVEAVQAYFSRFGAAARAARANATLGWPATGAITSYFGASHPLGIDIGQSDGDALAATDGVVVYAGGNRCCSYGLFVIVDGPDGIRTLYSHFDSLRVKTGERVRRGQPLGVVGCTGTCDGVHLHFEVWDHGVRQDPLGYLP